MIEFLSEKKNQTFKVILLIRDCSQFKILRKIEFLSNMRRSELGQSEESNNELLKEIENLFDYCFELPNMSSKGKKNTIPEIKDLLKEINELISWCKNKLEPDKWRFNNKIFSEEFLDEKMLKGDENIESAKEVKHINDIVEDFMNDIRNLIAENDEDLKKNEERS